jgi:hypothetical protein
MAIKVFKKIVTLPAKPKGLTVEEMDCYLDLVQQLKENQTHHETPLEVVLLGAKQKARLNKLYQDVQDLRGNFLIETMTNPARLHPLVQELRTMERTYLDTLGKMLLTTTSRLGAKEHTGITAGDSKSKTPLERASASLDFDD